jgi:pantoate ligase/cytidylate kinase
VIIAIDGPAGAGKSTVARAVAERLGIGYLDTGAMYRAVTYLALRGGVSPHDGAGLEALARAHEPEMRPVPGGMSIRVDGTDVSDEIRDPDVTAAVSEVAAHAGVREAVTAVQRRVLASGSWVCDGRDIGTTVWPSAELKVFLTASAAERARRRAADLAARGVPEPVAEVQAQLAARDHLDTTRTVSPLRPASDALHLDTSDLTVDQVVETITGWATTLAAGAHR